LLFDSTGRSTGCAEVIFRSASDALQAFNEYNGVQLDGNDTQGNLFCTCLLPQ